MCRLASTFLASLVALGLASCAPAPADESCNDSDDGEFVIPAAF